MAKKRTPEQQKRHEKQASANRVRQEMLKRESKAALVKRNRQLRRVAQREIELEEQRQGVVRFPRLPVEPVVTLFIPARQVKLGQRTVRIGVTDEDKLGRFIIVPVVKVRDFFEKRVKEGRKWRTIEVATKWRKFECATPTIPQEDWHHYSDPHDWIEPDNFVGLTAPLTGWLRIGMLKRYFAEIEKATERDPRRRRATAPPALQLRPQSASLRAA